MSTTDPAPPCSPLCDRHRLVPDAPTCGDISRCFPDICPRHILHPGSADPCDKLDDATIHEEHTHATAVGIIAITHGDVHTARLAISALTPPRP